MLLSFADTVDPIPTAESQGFFERVGQTITKLRIFFMNTLFILFMAVIVATIAASCQSITVPENAALLMNPQGVIVETKRYPAGLQQILQSAPEEVEFADLLKVIELAEKDDDIDMLVLYLDELYGLTPARASRLGAVLAQFRTTGKQVISYGNDYTQGQYHLASFADAVYMHPQGQVILPGFGSYSLYFNELLTDYDVNIHIFRVGEYKSATEPLTRNDMSDASRQASEVLYTDLWQYLLSEIAENRAIPVHDVDDYAQNFPARVQAVKGDIARAALEGHLIDELLTADQVKMRIGDKVGYDTSGQEINGIEYASYLQARANPEEGDDTSPQIAVLVVQGPIVSDGPVGQTASAASLNDRIRRARLDKAVRALVLRVDSPGGEAFASELIRQELELFQLSGRPVVASMGAVAASGGYWIASTADEIVAEATTITGSIGIFAYLTTFEDTLRRYGVHSDGVGTTSNLLSGDPFVGISDGLSTVLQARVEHGYEQFINLVARGRHKTPEEIEYVAQGRIWSGVAAMDVGLVDHLGGLQTATERAAQLAGLEAYGILRLTPAVDPRQRLLAELVQNVDIGLPRTWVDSRPVNHLTHYLQIAQTLGEPGENYAFCLVCPTNSDWSY